MNKIHHTNFCRQLKISVMEWLISHQHNHDKQVWDINNSVLRMVLESEKFLLPTGGEILDDKEYRALDENEELNLPFETIALEYVLDGEEIDGLKITKEIILARQEENHIRMFSAGTGPNIRGWGLSAPFFIPRVNYIDHNHSINGRPVGYINQATSFEHTDYTQMTMPFYRLLGFLNALSCINVSTSKSHAKKRTTKKSNIPFDDYHVLTLRLSHNKGEPRDISGSHRSPREHLRRGHIRRCTSGVRTFVSSTIVNPGVGSRIKKDYRLQP